MSTELKTHTSQHEENPPHEKNGENGVDAHYDTKGDLGGEFMAAYTGTKHDITDEENDRVRWKIDKFLLPM